MKYPRGFILLATLLLGFWIFSAAVWLTRLAKDRQAAEITRQNWQQARLLALSGIEYGRYLRDVGRLQELPVIRLPLRPLEPDEWPALRRKAKMIVQIPPDGSKLPDHFQLVLAYDPDNRQIFSMGAVLNPRGVVQNQTLCKQKY